MMRKLHKFNLADIQSVIRKGPILKIWNKRGKIIKIPFLDFLFWIYILYYTSF